MDLGKDQLHRTLAHHPEESHAPEIIGTWRLRNRDQLRKRKAEAQEKQTSQWLLGREQKKRKYQRTGKGNQRGQKRQRNAEPMVEPPPQIEMEVEEVPALAENETEPPVTEALPLPASPAEAVPAEHPSEIHEESIAYQESSEDHEPAVQNHSGIGQDVAEPEDLAPKMSLKTAVCQDHPFKIIQDIAGPEVLSPKMCQETAECQDYSSKACQDMAEPKVYSKTCQETALPKDLASISEDVADPKGCSPEVSPRADVPEHYPLDTCQTIVVPEEFASEPDQEMAGTEGSFPKVQEVALLEDVSAETHGEAVEPEYFSHKTCKEIAVPTISFQKTIQETPGSEDYSPEIDQETTESEDYASETYQEAPRPEEYSSELYQETPTPENYSLETYQEMPGPEDLSIKTCKNRDVPKDCLPEPSQGASGLQDQDPNAQQEDAKDTFTFSPGNLLTEPIGYLDSCFSAKNGTPRQPSVCSHSRACLRIRKSIFNNPEHSLMGLEQFSHVWILFVFHKNGHLSSKAKVQPPRLNGAKTGVFSTRSPHRPNAIGLTLAKLEKVEGGAIYLSGIDMIHGTPVLDIKPYIADYDSPQNFVEPLEDFNLQHNPHRTEAVSQSDGKTDGCDQQQLSGVEEPQPCHSIEEKPKCPEDRASEENCSSPRDTTETQQALPEPRASVAYLGLESRSGQGVGVAQEQLGPHDPEEGTHRRPRSDGLAVLQGSNVGTQWVPLHPAGTAERAPRSVVPAWVKEAPVVCLHVRFTPHAEVDLERLSSGGVGGQTSFKYFQSAEEAKCAIEAVLSADPRSVYRRKLCQDRLFYFTIDVAHVTCWFGDGFAEVLRIKLAFEPSGD